MNLSIDSNKTKGKFDKLYLKKIGHDYIVIPFEIGLYGFAAVFTLIILTRLFAFVFGIFEIFQVTLNDLFTAVWGFFLISFAVVIKHLRDIQK